jgi:hypothetical protein
MSKHRIEYLFERYFTDNCTNDEHQEFLLLVNEKENDEEFIKLLEVYWQQDLGGRQVPGEVSERIFREIIQPPRKKFFLIPVKYPLWSLAGAAAIILMVVISGVLLTDHVKQKDSMAKTILYPKDIRPGGNKAILTLSNGNTIVLDSTTKGKLVDRGLKVIKLDNGLLTYQGAQNTVTSISYNTITTPPGGQYEVILADGTKVWINAASSLRFPTVFSGTQRELELKGEGYFEVTHDPSKTFVVKVGGMKVEVLGTHFNIMAYGDEESVNTTLLKGSVKLEYGTENRVLVPGEQGKWNKKEEMQVVKNADLEEALAWKNGRFQYHSTNLGVIMRQIARWYNVTIVYEGDVRAECFSGSIPRTDNVSQMLQMLELTNTIHFTVEGKSIIVKK